MNLERSIVVLSVILAVAFTACGTEKNNVTQNEEVNKAVEISIKNEDSKERLFDYMRAGLYARWDIVLSEDSDELSVDDLIAKNLNELYTEKNMTENYRDYLTEDNELSELVKAYYMALDNQIGALDTDGRKVDMDLYVEKGYYVRADILLRLYDEYGFDVSEEYRYCMNTMLYARELDDLQNVLIENCGVSIIGENSSGQSIKIIQFENKSDFSLSDVCAHFYLYDGTADDGGKEIYEAKSDIVHSWKSGSKVDFIFQENIPNDIVDKQKGWSVYFEYDKVDFDN